MFLSYILICIKTHLHPFLTIAPLLTKQPLWFHHLIFLIACFVAFFVYIHPIIISHIIYQSSYYYSPTSSDSSSSPPYSTKHTALCTFLQSAPKLPSPDVLLNHALLLRNLGACELAEQVLAVVLILHQELLVLGYVILGLESSFVGLRLQVGFEVFEGGLHFVGGQVALDLAVG